MSELLNTQNYNVSALTEIPSLAITGDRHKLQQTQKASDTHTKENALVFKQATTPNTEEYLSLEKHVHTYTVDEAKMETAALQSIVRFNNQLYEHFVLDHISFREYHELLLKYKDAVEASSKKLWKDIIDYINYLLSYPAFKDSDYHKTAPTSVSCVSAWLRNHSSRKDTQLGPCGIVKTFNTKGIIIQTKLEYPLQAKAYRAYWVQLTKLRNDLHMYDDLVLEQKSYGLNYLPTSESQRDLWISHAEEQSEQAELMTDKMGWWKTFQLRFRHVLHTPPGQQT